jgi:hypothetical protein
MRTGTLAVLAVTAALSGCGGSGAAKTASTTGSTTPGGSTPTTPAGPAGPAKAAYIAQADAVCRGFRSSMTQVQAQTRTVVAQGDTPKGFALAAAVVRRVAALEQAELTRLRALRSPGGPDAPVVATYLDQGGRALAEVGALATAFAKGDKTAIAAAEADGARTAATAKGLAQGYGFKVCGNGPAGNGL